MGRLGKYPCRSGGSEPRSGRGLRSSGQERRSPSASLVADRFHLLKNLRERLKELMDRKLSCLPEIEEHASDAIEAPAQGIKDQGAHQIAESQPQSEPEKHYRTGSPSPNNRPLPLSYHQFHNPTPRPKRPS